MAILEGYLRRTTAILKMPEAIARGLTQSAFFRELKTSTGTYRKQRMIQDWHNVAGTEARKDTYKYIRKDRLPAQKFVADVDWEMSSNYMYKYAVFTQEALDKELKPQFVNIMKQKPFTLPQIEAEIQRRWEDKDKYGEEPIAKLELIGIWHKVPSLEYPTPSPFLERE